MDAKQVVTNYHSAWTGGDVDAARVYLADDLDFQGSIDTFRRADDFMVALAMFQKMLRSVTLIQSFYSEDGAALLYDCDTMSPAGAIRTAEFFTVRDGKIKSIRLVFDATELRKLMAG
jgi:ketosteroid isomerase-like protein